MYEFRKMSLEERKEILRQRRLAGHPLHAPLRIEDAACCCLITAACYLHQTILFSQERLETFEKRLLLAIREIPGSKVAGWVILPNHYHLLLDAPLTQLRRAIGRLHNGTSTEWNREDGAHGRRVWYRFRCDPILDDAHCHQSLNYIHKNPMKHGYVRKSTEWPWISLHEWLKELGEEAMRDQWRRHPIENGFGGGWDD